MAMTDQTRIALLEQATQHHRELLVRQEGIQKSTAESLQKLVLLEERHIETRQALDRAFGAIKSVQVEVDAIREQMPQLLESRKWLIACFVGIVAMVGVAAFRLVFIAPQPQAYHPEPPAKVSGP